MNGKIGAFMEFEIKDVHWSNVLIQENLDVLRKVSIEVRSNMNDAKGIQYQKDIIRAVSVIDMCMKILSRCANNVEGDFT